MIFFLFSISYTAETYYVPNIFSSKFIFSNYLFNGMNTRLNLFYGSRKKIMKISWKTHYTHQIFFYIGDIIADWFFEVIFYNWNFHISIYKIVFLIFSPDLFLFLLERVIILGRYFICLWIVHIAENASNDICHFIHIPLFSPFFLIFVCSQVKLVPKSNFRGLENLSLFCYSVVFFIWIFNNWIEN